MMNTTIKTNDSRLLQLSAGKGPEECSRVVALVLEQLLADACKNSITATVIDKISGSLHGTLLSVTVQLYGRELDTFLLSWEGTVQWIAQSPYRRMHKRKNWFISIRGFDSSRSAVFDEREISFKTCRSSGPGGQHVNKTETAVRATHGPSGISVVASTSRSQHQNKKEAIARLRLKVLDWQLQQQAAMAMDQWQQHNHTKRGDAIRTFTAPLL